MYSKGIVAHMKTRSNVQDTVHAQEPIASIHKWLILFWTLALPFKAVDNRDRVNQVRKVELV